MSILVSVIQPAVLCACMSEDAIPTAIRWAPLLGALATFLAVLVALFRESFFLRWRRSKLSVTIKAEPPDSHKTEFRFSDGTVVPSYVFRLWVVNSGKTTAERVQVFARRLSRRHANGEFRNETRFLPMNLLWSHGVGVTLEGLARGMGHHCDLGYIFPPDSVNPNIRRPARIPQSKTCLQLETEVRPFTGTSHLEPGIYHLELRAAGANTRPIDVVIEISLDGGWHDEEADMLSRGVGLRVL